MEKFNILFSHNNFLNKKLIIIYFLYKYIIIKLIYIYTRIKIYFLLKNNYNKTISNTITSSKAGAPLVIGDFSNSNVPSTGT